MKGLLLGASLLAATAAMALDQNKLPITTVTDSPAFDTAEAAAIAALERVTNPFGLYEKGGGILERDGKFFYTSAVTNESKTSLNYVIHKMNKDMLVAMYHTHPYVEDPTPSDGFSHIDMDVAKKLGVISYIAGGSIHWILRYDPAHPRRFIAAQGDRVAPLLEPAATAALLN